MFRPPRYTQYIYFPTQLGLLEELTLADGVVDTLARRVDLQWSGFKMSGSGHRDRRSWPLGTMSVRQRRGFRGSRHPAAVYSFTPKGRNERWQLAALWPLDASEEQLRHMDATHVREICA